MIAPVLALLLQMAPTAAVPCTAVAAPPAGLSAWSAAAVSLLTIGQPAELALQPSAKVTFPITPDRAPVPGSFAGVFPVTIVTAGTYRIALSAGAWIDVVDAGKTSLKSIAHTEGPSCSGIRKIVDFTLVPGSYNVQLSGAKAADIRLLIAAK